MMAIEDNVNYMPEEDHIPLARKCRRRYIVSIALFQVATGLLDAWIAKDVPTAKLQLVFEVGILLYLVCQIVFQDARIRGYAIGYWLSQCLIFLTPFSILFYLIDSRGWKMGFVAIAKTAGVFLAYECLYLASFFATLLLLGVSLRMSV